MGVPKREPAALTKTMCAAAPVPTAGEDFWPDKEVAGFGLRVYASGKKVFTFRCRPSGARGSKERKISIGEFPAISVETARKMAKGFAADVTRGIDPGGVRDTRRKEDVARQAEETMAEAFERYLADQKHHLKPTSLEDYEGWWRRNALPVLGRKKVKEVTSADVKQLHQSLSAKPTTANRVRAVLSSFFTWAEVEPNPAVAGKRGVRLYREEKRERFLSEAEYARLGEALRRAETEGLPPAPQRRRKPAREATAKHTPKMAGDPIPAHPETIAALRFAALTGWRIKEVLNLTRAQASKDVIILPETNTGRSMRHIGAAARAVIAPLMARGTGRFVFPGRQGPEKPVTDVDRLWAAVRIAAGIEDVTPHGLRHSFATVATGEGFNEAVLAGLLGHSRGSTTAIYAHVNPRIAQRAADQIADTIAGYLGLEASDPVSSPAPSGRPHLKVIG
jgi:integrase